MNLEVSWSQLKSFLDARALKAQYVEFDHIYVVVGIDGPFSFTAKIIKSSPSSADQTDFETNYKPAGNAKIAPTDSDGAALARNKITKAGWHFQCHTLEFTTALLASTYNCDKTETDLGFSDIKFYNNSDTELVAGTQAELIANCVKTVITLEIDHDIEVIGGVVYQSTAPSSDVRLWVTAIPDLPAPNGSIPFCQGGANLKYMGTGEVYKIDGKTPKLLPYDAVYHTNKFELTLRHPVGHQHSMMLMMKLFRENS